MTSFEKPETRPGGDDAARFLGFDYLQYYCSNARTAASFYISRLGFQPYAYAGLETNSRKIATHVLRQGDIILAFTNSLEPDAKHPIAQEVARCGDFVRDVAFRVDDCKAMYAKAIERGAKSVLEPTELKDEHGSVWKCTIQTYGNVVHSFIQRDGYSGKFLPGFQMVEKVDPLVALLPPGGAEFIDHVVGNMPDGKMTEVCQWYMEVLDFHRFWTVDDTQVHTEYSALRSTVMCDFDRSVRMPINEPAEGKKKSQIQEYVEWYGGAGVQHVAFNTPDVITTIRNLRARGCDFLPIPKTYYDDVRKRLAKSPVEVKESVDVLEELGILIDFDDQGYLLQLFTRPVEDRPTLFYEFIQRNNHEGFGAGNFKSLFESIERDQARRGNLENDATAPSTEN